MKGETSQKARPRQRSQSDPPSDSSRRQFERPLPKAMVKPSGLPAIWWPCGILAGIGRSGNTKTVNKKAPTKGALG